MGFEEGIKRDFQIRGLNNEKDGAVIYLLKRVKEKQVWRTQSLVLDTLSLRSL